MMDAKHTTEAADEYTPEHDRPTTGSAGGK